MDRNEFKDLWSNNIVILDGATGTELSYRGMPRGVCPEQWIMENPGIMLQLQQEYSASGSAIIYTPTFGANRYKLEEFKLADETMHINRELAKLSKSIAGNSLVFGNLAPTGRFIEPFGDVAFEDAITVYKEQAQALLDGGVDGFIIETMMDLQEARAALLAIREICELPVMVSMTYNKEGRTLNGNDPLSCLITLQALGADAVGCNCSTGPADMLEIIKIMKPHATVPLFAKPNAGMPSLKNGQTVFDMGPEQFVEFVPAFIEAGVNLFGGCCGTGPRHIELVAQKAACEKGKDPEVAAISAVSSSRMTKMFGLTFPFTVVGERINPTGKKALQAELREGKTSIIKQFAIEQKMKGADILDVNMGLSGIDEKEMMLMAIRLLSKFSDLPLCIDTTKPDVVEAALRLYPGRALVNSISGEKDRIEKTLPVAAKYGAMFILLPLTDEGIPKTAAERKEVVSYVLERAQEYGYSVADVTVDGLVMTVSSDQQAALETLNLIEWCARELHANSICGLSNVSFGLPERKWINAAFLGMAISRGLTMAIANPSSEELMEVARSANVIHKKSL